MSLAGAEAAEARRVATTTLGYYNVKLGPSAWRFTAGLGTEWSDNIRLTRINPLSDLIYRPELRTRMTLPVTQQNSITLNVSGGYSKYVRHSEFDRWFIRPGSELSFDLYSGDFWINLHDRFSILQDTYQDPTIVGSADLSRLENVAGLVATWDLNKAILRFGYDHVNYVSLQGHGADYPNGDSEVMFLNAGYAPVKGILYGLELGSGFVQYEENLRLGFERATQWNAGLFTDWQISQYVRISASGGYTAFMPQETSVFRGATDFHGIYARLVLAHRLNQYLDYALCSGRNLNFSFYGGTIDLWYVRLTANWRVLRQTSLSTGLDYEHGKQITFGSEVFDRLGPSVSLGHDFTRRLRATLRYQYYWRNSDLPARDYTVNVVNLGLLYTF